MVTAEMIRVTQGQVNGLSDILTGEMLKQEVTSESSAGYIHGLVHRPSLHATTLGPSGHIVWTREEMPLY
jgi:hypothetical protein